MSSEISAEIRTLFKLGSRRLRFNERDYDRIGLVLIEEEDLLVDEQVRFQSKFCADLISRSAANRYE